MKRSRLKFCELHQTEPKGNPMKKLLLVLLAAAGAVFAKKKLDQSR
ncbi:MAG TPA: DLW-39 family protein [Nocardioides sp.]|jgi:hypothetical protein